jgi:hypothetical protein
MEPVTNNANSVVFELFGSDNNFSTRTLVGSIRWYVPSGFADKWLSCSPRFVDMTKVPSFDYYVSGDVLKNGTTPYAKYRLMARVFNPALGNVVLDGATLSVIMEQVSK